MTTLIQITQRPILMSTPMVEGTFAGRKWETRRIIDPQPIKNQEGYYYWHKQTRAKHVTWNRMTPGLFKMNAPSECPYGQPGDILWVRETWCKVPFESGPEKGKIHYEFKSEADIAGMGNPFGEKWKPSIHLPKAAARLWLEITKVRVERLQEITEADAIAEGVEPINCFNIDTHQNEIRYRDYSRPTIDHPRARLFHSAIASYRTLWEKINGVASWHDNPWVWVIAYKKIDRPE
jgi:hypothetical protein